MQTTFQQSRNKQGFFGGLWLAITELEFVTAFFTWLFMAASRLAEPLMSISAIYIILCAGIPTWKITGLYNTGEAIMIAAPEIILPGAFVLAGQASARQDKKAWMLHSISWLFVGLTFLTLADLFIFHFSGNGLNIIMWARCAVGIGYSILLRVLTHNQPLHQTPALAPTPAMPDYQEIARHLKTMFPQPTPAPQIDYQEIARTITPLIAAPQVDHQEIARHIAPMLEATFKATIVREIKATVAPIAGPPVSPQIEARASSCKTLGPVIEATTEGHKSTKARTTKRDTGPLPKATIESQSQDEATDTHSAEEKLEAAYQQLIAEGKRISGRALAPLARVNKNRAAQWLRATYPETITEGQGQQDSEPGPDEGQELNPIAE